MSDVVVVMHEARIAQVGTPRELYEAPTNLFVADFLGDSNLLSAKIVAVSGDCITAAISNGEVIHATRQCQRRPR
jgi:ABC-type Fe3+/spermidine/putrescine transport system ATPase subunit